MLDDWFQMLKFPMEIDQWRILPRNAAYKYEYFDGKAVLSPRPHCGRAVLSLRLARATKTEGFSLRPIRKEDWNALVKSMAWAFCRVQPFESLNDQRRVEAAKDCIAYTRKGGDGPLIPKACFVAVTNDDRGEHIVGAILVTLRPAESKATGVKLPHVTWIFVSPLYERRGIASSLLAAAAKALRAKGYRFIESTILKGNATSMMWHWRMGFRLLGDGFTSARKAIAKARRRKRSR